MSKYFSQKVSIYSLNFKIFFGFSESSTIFAQLINYKTKHLHT